MYKSMLERDQQLIMEKAVDLFGKGSQSIIAMEESAELIQMLCNITRIDPISDNTLYFFKRNKLNIIEDNSKKIKEYCKDIRNCWSHFEGADIKIQSYINDNKISDMISDAIADAQIMLESLKYIFNPLDDKIEMFKQKKIERLSGFIDKYITERSDPKKPNTDPIQE